jgi:hypothetical protein
MFVSHQGKPLREVLARNAQGWPLAVSDSEGQIGISRLDVHARTLWLESESGAVYTASATANRLIASKLSEKYSGTVTWTADGVGSGARAYAHYWRETKSRWAVREWLAAAPLERSVNGEYSLELLPGEGIWFAARGHEYRHCTSIRLAAGEEGGDEACPKMRPAAIVHGVVVDDDGATVPNAEILLSWQPLRDSGAVIHAPSQFGASLPLRSDSSGRFWSDRVGGFPTGNRQETTSILVKSEGYLPVDAGLSLFKKGENQYEITLSRGAIVKGRVLERYTEEPIAGAEVALGRFASSGYTVALGSLERMHGPYGTVRFTQTSTDGTFSFTGWPGRWDFIVRANGKAQHQIRGVELGSTGLELGVVYLEPGLELEGVVLDESRNPVQGARIEAAGTKTQGVLGANQVSPRVLFWDAAVFTADAEGRFTVPGLDENSRVGLRLSAPGFGDLTLAEVSPTTTPMEIVLQREAVIQGAVTVHGEPTAAQVVLAETNESAPVRSSPTDEDGRFRLSQVPAGSYNISVASSRPGIRPWLNSVVAVAGETVELTVELREGDKNLVGAVTAGGTGLPGVRVQSFGRHAISSGSGSYRLQGLPAGLVHVTAEHEDRSLTKHVQIAGATGVLDFDFSKHLVTGKAVWTDGPPIADLQVSFGVMPRVTVSTRSDGTFETRLGQGKHPVVAQLADGGWVSSRGSLTVEAPISDAVLRFDRQLRIKGTVYGLAEEELRRLKIEAISGGSLRRREGWPKMESGQFVINRIFPDTWVVAGTVGAGERHARSTIHVVDQDVEVDLKFVPLHHLSGVVRMDGEPLAGTQVLLLTSADMAEARRVWTKHDGVYRFSDLEAGNYFLGAGSSLQEVEFRGDQHLDIQLGSGRLTGTVLGADGSLPLAGAPVLIWPNAATPSLARKLGIVRRTYTGTNGTFTFASVPEGYWTVEVSSLPLSAKAVQVAPNSVSTLDWP